MEGRGGKKGGEGRREWHTTLLDWHVYDSVLTACLY